MSIKLWIGSKLDRFKCLIRLSHPIRVRELSLDPDDPWDDKIYYQCTSGGEWWENKHGYGVNNFTTERCEDPREQTPLLRMAKRLDKTH